MFCVYVYWIWQHNSHALEEMDQLKVRASDFAVCVRRLPAHNTDPHGLKAGRRVNRGGRTGGERRSEPTSLARCSACGPACAARAWLRRGRPAGLGV